MEKTEKELLELAAKAADYKIIFTDPLEECIRIDGYRDDDWNPLEDDGDALRLAIDLGIEIHPDLAVAEVYSVYMAGNFGYNKMQEFGDDKYAATRLVIVCSAAHIGEKMP